MKLIIAIVRDDDGIACMMALNAKGFSVTKLATTGGFLRAGNTTLLIGAEQDKCDSIIEIIREKCKTRERATTTMASAGIPGAMSYPVEITVGGATIFVVDVDRFEKV